MYINRTLRQPAVILLTAGTFALGEVVPCHERREHILEQESHQVRPVGLATMNVVSTSASSITELWVKKL